MDDPHDPLATARSGGLDSAIDVEEVGRGFLGEVLVLGKQGESHTVEKVRGIKIVELVKGYNRSAILSEEGQLLAQDEWDVDVPLLSASLSETFGAGIGLEDGRLYTWGEGKQGELGLGHTRGSRVPEVVPTVKDTTFVQVSCGKMHAAAVSEQGAVFTWGRGFEGQLGQGLLKEIDFEAEPHMAVRLVPKLVASLSKQRVIKVSCGSHFTAALDTQGSIWTWGEGLMGQLGTGRSTRRCIPARVIGPDHTKPNLQEEPKEEEESKTVSEQLEDYLDLIPPEDREKVLSNDTPSTALTTREEHGNHDQVQHVPEDQHRRSCFFIGLACGESHVLACDEAGHLTTWGLNTFGQLGLGDKKQRYEPAFVPPQVLDGISTVSASGHSSCAVTEDGKVYSWGKSVSGEALETPSKVKLRASVKMAACIAKGEIMALVPTTLSNVSPSNGPEEGGHELHIHGVGFWDADSIRVRFVPMRRKALPLEDEILSRPSETLADGIDSSSFSESERGDEVSESGSSDDESECSDGDMRSVKEVPGKFDKDSGTVVCTVPSSSQPGIVLVQVAMDGKSFTTSQVFYIYTQPCSIMSVEQSFLSFPADAESAERPLTIHGSNLLSMPELCVRLQNHDKFFVVPAQLLQTQDETMAQVEANQKRKGGSDTAPRNGKGPGVPASKGKRLVEEQLQDQSVSCVVDLAKAFQALRNGDEEESEIQVQVTISLNGLAFAPLLQESVTKACTLHISRLSVTSISPSSVPCVDGGEKVAKESEEDVTFLDRKVELYCSGIAGGCKKPRVRLFDGSLEMSVPATMKSSEGIIQFQPPAFPRTSFLPNGQGWGYRKMQVQVSIDDGVSWVSANEPLIFYHGEFHSVEPKFLPCSGMCELDVLADATQPGWVFPSCEPTARLEIGSDELYGQEKRVLEACTAKRHEDGSGIHCSFSSSYDFFHGAFESCRKLLHKQHFDKYLQDNLNEQGEELDESQQQQIREQAQTFAESSALAELVVKPFKAQLYLTVNGLDYMDKTFQVFLIDHPTIERVEPSVVVLRRPRSGDVAEESEQGEGELQEKQNKEQTKLKLYIDTETGVHETGNIVVRFSDEDMSFTQDVQGHIVQEEEQATEKDAPKRGGGKEKKDTGKKKGKDATKAKEPEPIQPVSTMRCVECQEPEFPGPGEYTISIAMNGAQFSGSTLTFTVEESQAEE